MVCNIYSSGVFACYVFGYKYDTHVYYLRFQHQAVWINNKVNGLGWSIQWIQQILLLKQTDCLCKCVPYFYSPSISSTFLRSNSVCLNRLFNCLKVNCETNSFGSGIVVVFAAVTIICIGTAWWPYRSASVDFCIDSVIIVNVSSQP